MKTNNNPSFIYFLINQPDFNNHVMMRCTGTSYPAISGNELSKIPISICTRKEQDKIAMLLSRLDQKIKTEKRLLNQFEAQKNYLLQNLFPK
ncbi:hypothetical protein CJD36_022375 [Flavipsychrobacter stenotrophus]|uniref:Type I restriction modification DNA specificity domain-containing protein n=1 Tax=Flavipsychrobacter stenotrophus TaxID=2077091 RepID=A0A2S7SPI0_9BACT|nr:hypothetical protein CJD36_022375 [Flavipsychrobacter stenotrophus]